MIIKGARQCCPDSAHRLEVVDAGPEQSLHAAEVPQQRAALRGAQAGYRFQHGLIVPARSPLAMAGDGEAMRFIANALDDAQTL
jgi:hypothetical protein